MNFFFFNFIFIALLPRWRVVSVNTIGRKIDFIESVIAVSTAYFYYAKFHFNILYQIKTKWTSQRQNAGVDSNPTWQRGKKISVFVQILNILYQNLTITYIIK